MEFVVEPWKHQREAFERAKDLPEFALFFEMGAGKTSTCINLLRYKFSIHERLLRTIILGPPIILENWKREWAKYSKVPASEIVVLNGTGAKRLKDFIKHSTNADGVAQPKIFITNYESLLMPDLFQAMLAWKPEALVADEVHKCKDHTTKRSKATYELSKLTTYRYALTGTPVLNSPLDLFSQFLILDHGKTFDKKFYVFQALYFYNKNANMRGMKNYFPDWRIKPGATDEIHKKIQAKSMTVKKTDCLDLPPLVRQEFYVELSPEQKKHYNDMKDDYITFLGDEACTAELALTKALRLQQIVSGFIKLENGYEVPIKTNPRQQALRDLLEELTPNHKVIVWATFQENYIQVRKVCEELGIRYVEVHGQIVSHRQRQENVDMFNHDPNVRVLLGHPASGGVGINLVAASYSIFYSRDFSLENDLQAEARNHRGGSEIHERITRIDLVAKGTIDEFVLKRLSEKLSISDRVLKQSIKEL